MVTEEQKCGKQKAEIHIKTKAEMLKTDTLKSICEIQADKI
jgi:hypothetical protein